MQSNAKKCLTAFRKHSGSSRLSGNIPSTRRFRIPRLQLRNSRCLACCRIAVTIQKALTTRRKRQTKRSQHWLIKQWIISYIFWNRLRSLRMSSRCDRTPLDKIGYVQNIYSSNRFPNVRSYSRWNVDIRKVNINNYEHLRSHQFSICWHIFSKQSFNLEMLQDMFYHGFPQSVFLSS